MAHSLLPQAVVNFSHLAVWLQMGMPREVLIPACFFCTPELDQLRASMKGLAHRHRLQCAESKQATDLIGAATVRC